MTKTNNSFTLRAITEGAMMVVLAQLLGYLKLWRMPWGGSVTLIMLPIFVYAFRHGLANGLLAGFALGILQFMFDGGFVLGWQSILGDYVIAYGLLGLAGIFAGKKYGVLLGSLVGGLGRFASLTVTGAVVWGIYMPDEFLGLTMTNPWIYSVLYNLCYMVPSLVLTILVQMLLQPTLNRLAPVSSKL